MNQTSLEGTSRDRLFQSQRKAPTAAPANSIFFLAITARPGYGQGMTALETRKWMSKETMIRKIVDTLDLGGPGDAPAYTLILGSGASYGSVPTAREMLGVVEKGAIHEKCIPAYLHTRKHKGTPWPTALTAQKELVTQFWKDFPTHVAEVQPFREWLLDPAADKPSCNPDVIAAAYKALFEPRLAGGLNAPAEARRYLRAITLGEGGRIRLNGTHFFLASLLSLQSTHADPGSPFHRRRPFARTLFTTNFDPLLQVSLQLFQVLYYMTDRPELLPPDALATDDHPAVHLFYAHGSVHRPFLANADQEIAHLKTRNAQSLSAYLSQHGVIVLGYSGWDDCLLSALNQCTSFSHNLYWLCRGEGSITPAVGDFLNRHPSAFCVNISDGAEFMSQLHSRLCPGVRYTELLDNPIPFLQQRLDQVDLQGIAAPEVERPGDPAPPKAGPDGPTLAQATPPAAMAPEERRTLVLELLKEAAGQFEENLKTGGSLPTLKLRADQAYVSDDWPAVIALCTRLIERATPPADKAQALFRRAYAHGQQGDTARAIEDYSRVIDLAGAPVEQVAIALNNRGVTHGHQGEPAKAIEDYSRVVELAGAPVEQVAQALYNRGFTHGQQGDTAKAMEDYSRVIDLAGAPVEQVAIALNNRGVAHGRQGDTAKAMEDYSRVIDLAGVPVEHVAMALFNRGVTHGQQGDTAKAMEDYSRVIDLAGAPVERVAQALINRGVAYGRQGDTAREIEDYSRVVDLASAPLEQVAKALFNRGVTHGQQGDTAKAMEDYGRVVELAGTPVEDVADALYNRGVAHGQQGDTAKAMEDYSAVLALPGCPPHLREVAEKALQLLIPPPAGVEPAPPKKKRPPPRGPEDGTRARQAPPKPKRGQTSPKTDPAG